MISFRSVVRRVSAVAVLSVAGIVLIAGLSGGCRKSSVLATGYEYTPLRSSPVQRKAYYAGPFTPEARAAAAESNDLTGTRRTGEAP